MKSPKAKYLGSRKALNAILREREAKRQEKNPKKPKVYVCPLCEATIPKGGVLQHKKTVHGEQMIAPTPAQVNKKGVWVSLVSGGLPSLGKRSR